MELERKKKLKFFAILALRKHLQPEIAKKSFVLGISVTYTNAEAILATQEVMKDIELNCSEFTIPALLMKINVEDIVKIPEGKVIAPSSVIPLPQPAVSKIQKSNQDMISYIRLVFDQVGTETEKKVVEKVIKKFEEKNKNG